MSKAKAIMIVAFVLTFVAGAVAGLAGGVSQHRPHDRASWLAGQLKLTPDQQEKMAAVWKEAREAGRGIAERSRTIRTERDEAIRALLTEQQRAQYDAIREEFARKSEELDKERHKGFEEAHRKTEQILTPEQKKKYDELINRRLDGERRPGGSREPGKTNDHTAPHGGA